MLIFSQYFDKIIQKIECKISYVIPDISFNILLCNLLHNLFLLDIFYIHIKTIVYFYTLLRNNLKIIAFQYHFSNYVKI